MKSCTPQSEVRVHAYGVVRMDPIEFTLCKFYFIVWNWGDVIHCVTLIGVLLHQRLPLTTRSHLLIFYAVDPSGITEQLYAFSSGAYIGNLSAVINSLGIEHLLATVLHFRCDDGAHTLLDEPLV